MKAVLAVICVLLAASGAHAQRVDATHEQILLGLDPLTMGEAVTPFTNIPSADALEEAGVPTSRESPNLNGGVTDLTALGLDPVTIGQEISSQFPNAPSASELEGMGIPTSNESPNIPRYPRSRSFLES